MKSRQAGRQQSIWLLRKMAVWRLGGLAPDAGNVCGLSECMVISIFLAVGAVVRSLSFSCG